MKDSDKFFGWQVNPNLNSPGERRVSNHHDEPPSPTPRHSVTYFVPIWIGFGAIKNADCHPRCLIKISNIHGNYINK